jgi:FtsZ-interacting cell division protein ZipA
MSTAALIIAAVVIVAILIVGARLYSTQQARQRNATQQRSEQLRQRFGPEYDRTVAEKGDVRSAESELTARQKRVSGFDIRPLAADESQSFNNQWQVMQATFVDDPSTAVHDADALVGRVMAARGYPESDYEQRSADVSVDHPAILDHYRTAHEIALRHAEGQANTEDLRQAVLNSHALFTEMVDEPPTVTEPPTVETSPDSAVLVAAQ